MQKELPVNRINHSFDVTLLQDGEIEVLANTSYFAVLTPTGVEQEDKHCCLGTLGTVGPCLCCLAG